MNNYYRPTGFGGFSFFPPVIKNLLIINASVFLVQVLGERVAVGNGLSLGDTIVKYFALIPIGTFSDAAFYPWQLITYQFLHGGFGHIFWNMFVLWMFGMEIENYWGSKKFLIFYLLCGIGAGLCHLLISPLLGAQAPVLGASGAIFGVTIAFAMIYPDRYIFLYFFIPIKAKYLITIYLLVYNLWPVLSGAQSNIAHLAHLGGALTGFIFIMLDKNTPVKMKNIFSTSSFRTTKPFNPLGGITDKFKKKENVEDAKYYEIKDDPSSAGEVTQEEIDRILDKISQSGYQNLTEKEKKILFQASKKTN